MNHAPDLQRVVAFYQTISPTTLAELDTIYSVDAAFKDPFNDVQGLPAITAIFAHMFVQVSAPRFVVTTHVLQGSDAFLTWDFLFRMKPHAKQETCVHGATHVRFAADGRVAYHRDYWDVAEELYEKLPVIGSLMRLLKKAAQ
jgi:hypothetical protein